MPLVLAYPNISAMREVSRSVELRVRYGEIALYTN